MWKKAFHVKDIHAALAEILKRVYHHSKAVANNASKRSGDTPKAGNYIFYKAVHLRKIPPTTGS